MGTQQILMIVLSVIVVGAAVTTGMQMFDTQSKNQIRNAITIDMMQMGVQAQAWFRTPGIMGGPVMRIVTEENLPNLVRFIDYRWGGVGPHATPNATYTFAVASATSITILGASTNFPDLIITATVLLTGGNIQNHYGISIEPTNAAP